MIRLGPAGNIESDTTLSLKKIKELGLHAQEIEFVRHVYMKNQMAKDVGRVAKDLGISLSIHAPYFINVNAGITLVLNILYFILLILAKETSKKPMNL